jgi:hypothetical protein
MLLCDVVGPAAFDERLLVLLLFSPGVWPARPYGVRDRVGAAAAATPARADTSFAAKGRCCSIISPIHSAAATPPVCQTVACEREAAGHQTTTTSTCIHPGKGNSHTDEEHDTHKESR